MASRWFLIVRNGSCPECGLVASSLAEGDLGVAIIAEAQLWGDLLARLSEAPSLRARPAPGVWSSLEDAGHVRDTLTLFADRIQHAIEIENPHFGYQDQEMASRFQSTVAESQPDDSELGRVPMKGARIMAAGDEGEGLSQRRRSPPASPLRRRLSPAPRLRRVDAQPRPRQL